MSPSSVVCLVLACLFSSGIARASNPAPLTAWASGAYLAGAADLKALPAAQALDNLFSAVAGLPTSTQLLVEGLLRDEPLGEQRPDAVVVFASGAESLSPAVQQNLGELSAAAASSLHLPNAVHQGTSHPVFAGLRRSAKHVSVKLLGDCGGAYLPSSAPATAEALEQQLEGVAGRAAPIIVVVCPPASDSGLIEDEGTADAEVELLEAAQKLLTSLVPKHLLVHATHAASSVRQQQSEQRRRLMQVAAYKRGKAANHTKNYTECDPICRRHVMFFEGLIVLIVVIVAVLIGVSCMHMVDVPTRFSQPLGSRAHQE